MYICCMENHNVNTTEEQGSNVDPAVARKIQDEQERAMASYYKNKTPNLKAQRAYYEELAGIWKARLDELKYRMEFIQLSVELEKGFNEASSDELEKPTDGEQA